MCVPVLERMLVNALGLAEQHLRAEGRIVPLLFFRGPGGEAVLRLDLSPGAAEERLLAKARLMATALGAEACTWVFESALETPGQPARPAVVAIAEVRGARGTAFAEIDAGSSERRLVRFDCPLAAAGLADGAGPLARYVRRAEGENAAAEAWRELEAMGVNRSDGRRPLN